MTTPITSQQDALAAAGEEFEVLLISDDLEPGYAVLFPTLPGCYSQGEDREDALAMAVDAIQCHLALPYGRPTAPAGERQRLIAEYTADGCWVEVATVGDVILKS